MEEWDEAKSDWAEYILCSLVAISPLPAVPQFKGFATALPGPDTEFRVTTAAWVSLKSGWHSPCSGGKYAIPWSSEYQPLLAAEKACISLVPQRLSAPKSHLHTLIRALQVPGTEMADTAVTLQSKGGKEAFIENLLHSRHLSLSHLLVYTSTDVLKKMCQLPTMFQSLVLQR